jgi:DNA primase
MSDPVQEIKDKADILDLISEIIPVKRAGSSHVAVCPFHNDTKPSMHISTSKGIFKCFACGAGGDVFKFWSEYYQKDFKETLRDLANKYGVTLQEFNKEKSEEKNLFVKLHNLAAEFFHQKLLLDQKAQKARNYLNERGLSTETIAKFKLGFASSDKNDPRLLIKHLQAKLENVTDNVLIKASLAYKTENGDVIDRFRHRLMIPVLDERSRCIAFGARTLDDNFGPKYINSAETDIYIKGDNLYGLDQAKESIRKKDAVVLVEGFFDVISLKQAGFENIVANQGTALTANQIKKLSKFSLSKRIYLCFDTDAAGEKATDSAAEVVEQTLAQSEYELRVIRVPGGKDPDEFIKENSLEAFEKIVAEAPYYIDYKIEKYLADCDMSDSFAKEKTAKKVSELINKVQKDIIRFDYIKKVSERMNLPERFFATKTDNPYQKTQEKPKQIKVDTNRQENQSIRSIETELIVLFLKNKNYLEKFLEEEKSACTLEAKSLINILIDVIFENPDLDDDNSRYLLLQDKAKEEAKLANLIADIGFMLEDGLLNDTLYEERYQKLSSRLSEYSLKIELENLKTDMKRYDPNSKEWLEIYQRKLEQTRKIQSLKY